MTVLSREGREDYTVFLSQYSGKENTYCIDLRRFGAVEADS